MQTQQALSHLGQDRVLLVHRCRPDVSPDGDALQLILTSLISVAALHNLSFDSHVF